MNYDNQLVSGPGHEDGEWAQGFADRCPDHLKIGRTYKTRLMGGLPNLVEVVGKVQKLSEGSDNSDRILVRDLEGYFGDCPDDEEAHAGGDLTFLYNVKDWTFVEVPLIELIEGILKEGFARVESGFLEDIWTKKDLKDFFSGDQGRFMLVGLIIGKGYTGEEMNEALPTSESVRDMVNTFTF